MAGKTPVDPAALREEVKSKYREVAIDPHGNYHFHTGRPLAKRLGYDDDVVGSMPDVAVESFSGVGNPFSLRRLSPGERVVETGSGAGFDSFIARQQVGPEGRVVGIDMTEEMLEKSRKTAAEMGLGNVEFREGIIEDMPVAVLRDFSSTASAPATLTLPRRATGRPGRSTARRCARRFSSIWATRSRRRPPPSSRRRSRPG